jgi:hypothetical protein
MTRYFRQVLITLISQTYSEILISNFTKIRPVGDELFRTDGRTEGQTDMTKLIVAFRNFKNGPKHITTVD